MKYRVLPLFFFIFVFFQFSNAQIDREIKAYVDSTELIMNNGRKLLVQSLIAKDELRVGKVYFYLNDLAEKRGCSFLNYNEELYTLLLMNNYRGFLDHVADANSRSNQGNCYNFTENYSDKLYILIKKQVDYFQSEINNQELNDENKALFEIFLYFVKNERSDEQYSALIKEFKSKYKNSSYTNFINNFLPAPIFKGSFAYGLGATSVLHQGNLKSLITPGVLFNFAMDFNINKVYSSMSINVGNVSLLKQVTFEDNTILPVNEAFTYSGGEIILGYFFVRKSPFHLAPYIGIGGYSLERNISPNENDPEYQIFNSFCFSPGIHTEIKITDLNFGQKYNNMFNSSEMNNYYNWMYGQSQSYLSLKLDAGYNIYTKQTPGYSGNSLFLKLALIWGIGVF
jgi:hypothetical protein